MDEIVDSRSHAWEIWPYEPAVPDPGTRGGVEQLIWEMDQAGVSRAVLVCAGIAGNQANNAYVAGCVGRYPYRLSQFADFDCSWSAEYHMPGAADRLRRLADAYPLKGVTHYLKAENDGWLASAAARECFAVAAERRLILSLSAPVAWQADVQALAAEFPSVPVLCHHLGWIRTAALPEGEALQQVLAGARLPNLLFKVSGFYYGDERPWDVPHTGTIAVVRALYEELGPTRLVWGSDYPVLRRHITYRQALEGVRSHCAFIPFSDRAAILGGTMAGLLDAAG